MTLEEAFREIRSANSKYSIQVIELEQELAKLKEENEKLRFQLDVFRQNKHSEDCLNKSLIKCSCGFEEIHNRIKKIGE